MFLENLIEYLAKQDLAFWKSFWFGYAELTLLVVFIYRIFTEPMYNFMNGNCFDRSNGNDRFFCGVGYVLSWPIFVGLFVMCLIKKIRIPKFLA